VLNAFGYRNKGTVVRYGSKPLEFAKGKNAIELNSETEVADVLLKVKEAAELTRPRYLYQI